MQMFKKNCGWLCGLAVLTLVAAGARLASAEIYYIDAENGSDTNAGTSTDAAWHSVQRANATLLKPGDQILLRAGDTFTGTLEIRSSGDPDHPLLISSYGQGSKPKLSGAGGLAALHLLNAEFIEIRNLDISNTASSPSYRDGVLVEADHGATLHHIYLRDLDVHDVSGQLGTDVAEKDTGGIGFQANGKENPSKFDDIRVEHCHIAHVDSTALWLQSEARINPRSPDWVRYRFTNVSITKNYLEDIGKNAMIVRDSFAPLIDGNIVRGSAMRLHGNAIMVAATEGAVISHNDVGGVQYGGMEGAAFDSDLNNIGTIIEYNYAHENGGGLVDFCAKWKDDGESDFNDGTVVRYNIVKNGSKRIISFDGPATNAKIYNNSVFISRLNKPHILNLNAFAKSPEKDTGALIANNIIYNEGDGDYEFASGKTYTIIANCFAGKHARGEPPDSEKIKADPRFGRMPPDPANPSASFAISADSPCAHSGVAVPNNGGHDFLGNPIPPRTPDRGAIQTSVRGTQK